MTTAKPPTSIPARAEARIASALLDQHGDILSALLHQQERIAAALETMAAAAEDEARAKRALNDLLSPAGGEPASAGGRLQREAMTRHGD